MAVAIPREFTKEYQDERAKFVSDFGDLTSISPTQAWTEISKVQVELSDIKKATLKNRMISVRKWSKVLDAAGIKHLYDFDDSMRIKQFLEATKKAGANGGLGSTAQAVVRTVEHFAEMLATLGYDKKNLLVKRVKNTIAQLELVHEEVKGYGVDVVAVLFRELTIWSNHRDLAPSFADRPSEGLRHRPASTDNINRLMASVAIASASGGRIGSLRKLKRADIDLDTGRFCWYERKGNMILNKSEAVLLPFQIEMVRPYAEMAAQKWPDAEAFFLTRSGRPVVNDDALRIPLRASLLHLGLVEEDETAGFHRFRHDIACAAIEEGLSHTKVAKALNNSETMIFKVYGAYMNNKQAVVTRQVFGKKLEQALGHVKDSVNPMLKPVTDALTMVWKQAQLEIDEEYGFGTVKLEQPALFTGIPAHVKHKTLATYHEDAWRKRMNSGADYGARTHDLGIKDNTKEAARIIAEGAKLALEELNAGNTEMAQAMLAHLSEWGGQ